MKLAMCDECDKQKREVKYWFIGCVAGMVIECLVRIVRAIIK